MKFYFILFIGVVNSMFSPAQQKDIHHAEVQKNETNFKISNPSALVVSSLKVNTSQGDSPYLAINPGTSLSKFARLHSSSPMQSRDVYLEEFDQQMNSIHDSVLPRGEKLGLKNAQPTRLFYMEDGLYVSYLQKGEAVAKFSIYRVLFEPNRVLNLTRMHEESIAADLFNEYPSQFSFKSYFLNYDFATSEDGKNTSLVVMGSRTNNEKNVVLVWIWKKGFETTLTKKILLLPGIHSQGKVSRFNKKIYKYNSDISKGGYMVRHSAPGSPYLTTTKVTNEGDIFVRLDEDPYTVPGKYLPRDFSNWYYIPREENILKRIPGYPYTILRKPECNRSHKIDEAYIREGNIVIESKNYDADSVAAIKYSVPLRAAIPDSLWKGENISSMILCSLNRDSLDNFYVVVGGTSILDKNFFYEHLVSINQSNYSLPQNFDGKGFYILKINQQGTTVHLARHNHTQGILFTKGFKNSFKLWYASTPNLHTLSPMAELVCFTLNASGGVSQQVIAGASGFGPIVIRSLGNTVLTGWYSNGTVKLFAYGMLNIN